MSMPPACLDIAVDHRIARLFRSIQHPRGISNDAGAHMNVIRNLGESIEAPQDEIRVTTELAGPTNKGGIAVVMQQPRQDHPFAKGTQAVIDDCASLAALKEVFDRVSCRTVDFQRDVSVVDLCPYFAEAHLKLANKETKSSIFNTCISAICDKEPDVVLCAGQVWEGDRSVKGEAWKLEHRGVGNTFAQYTTVRIRSPAGRLVKIERVSSAHPSLCMNHRPDFNQYRQLLILSVAETCGRLTGTWREEQWMEGIRKGCGSISKDQNNDTTKKNLQYYMNRFKLLIDQIQACIDDLEDSDIVNDYDSLLDTYLGSLYNNASLVLRQLSTYNDKEWLNKSRLDEITNCVIRLVNQSRKYRTSGVHAASGTALAVARAATRQIEAALIIDDTNASMSFAAAPKAFLDASRTIEHGLGELLYGETLSTPDSTPEIDLSSHFAGLGFGTRRR